MNKFILLTLNNNNPVRVNVAHIVMFIPSGSGSTISLMGGVPQIKVNDPPSVIADKIAK